MKWCVMDSHAPRREYERYGDEGGYDRRPTSRRGASRRDQEYSDDEDAPKRRRLNESGRRRRLKDERRG